jgi:hypothetical protein
MLADLGLALHNGSVVVVLLVQALAQLLVELEPLAFVHP